MRSDICIASKTPPEIFLPRVVMLTLNVEVRTGRNKENYHNDLDKPPIFQMEILTMIW